MTDENVNKKVCLHFFFNYLLFINWFVNLKSHKKIITNIIYIYIKIKTNWGGFNPYIGDPERIKMAKRFFIYYYIKIKRQLDGIDYWIIIGLKLRNVMIIEE